MKKLFWLISIALILATVLASPSLTHADAVFEVTDLVISPSQVSKGEPADISVTVKNTGDAPGSHSLELKINGTVEDTREVELDAYASETVTFTVTKDTPGEYSIEIADLKGVLTVTGSTFHVTDLDISPEEVSQGDPITISVNVANVGSEKGTYTLWLKLRKEITLGAKASQTVNFTIIEDTPGKHQLEIADLEGEFSVVEAPSAPPAAAPWWRNWWISGGIAGAIVLILLVIIITRLRQY